MSSILIYWMLNLAGNETVGVSFEGAQAGAVAEANSLAAIHGAGVVVKVADFLPQTVRVSGSFDGVG